MLTQWRKAAWCALGLVVFTAGLSAQGVEPSAALPPATTTGAEGEDRDAGADADVGQGLGSRYVLGVDDEITVQVLKAKEIPRTPVRIGPSGYISLPMVGRVPAAGRTPEQLEAELARRLGVYIRDPQVTVGISQFRSQPVSVIGAVNKPGVHQLAGRKTLIEILSLAGGVREDAGYKVKITRHLDWGPLPLPGAEVDSSGDFRVAEVNLEDVMEARNPEQNVLIMPHDVISVPRADMVYVIGGVHRSGGFVLSERENITVLQALALAGGLKATAKKKAVKILREADRPEQERIEIAVNLKRIMSGRSLDVPLERDDILFIPHSGGKAAARRLAEAGLSIGSGMMIWRVGR